MLNIVLYQPLIPQNTGNIARTCAVTGTRLHLVKPYGFSISQREIRRAGLDYWPEVDLTEHESFEAFCKMEPIGRTVAFTTGASRLHVDYEYKDGDCLLFGNEDAGLPAHVHEMLGDRRVRIPMRPLEAARCLNLANSVSVALYEALRQLGFPGLA